MRDPKIYFLLSLKVTNSDLPASPELTNNALCLCVCVYKIILWPGKNQINYSSVAWQHDGDGKTSRSRLVVCVSSPFKGTYPDNRCIFITK